MNQYIKEWLYASVGAVGLYAWSQSPRHGHPGLSELRRWRYAHRGLHDIEKGIPENSLAAFVRAREHGFGAELDVHLTRDRQLVVIHDSRLERLCGVSGVVENMTYDELKALPLLGTDHHAPLLSEVLEVYAGGPPLIVEIKTWQNNSALLCPLVDAMLKNSKATYCIESFDPRAVRWFKLHSPETIRGQLSMDFVHASDSDMPTWRKYVMTHLHTNCLTRPDFVAYCDTDRHIFPVRVSKLLGAQQVSWTIRSKEAMLAAEKDGAIVIFEKFLP